MLLFQVGWLETGRESARVARIRHRRWRAFLHTLPTSSWMTANGRDIAMATRTNPTRDSGAAAEVRSLIEQFADAARRFDLTWLEEHYAADVRAFDAIAKLEFQGRDKYLEHWRQCLELSPGSMIFEIHDLQIAAAGDLAVGHGLCRCGGVGPDGEEQTGWMRFTSVLARRDNRWLIVHEHFSAPFDPHTMQILNEASP